MPIREAVVLAAGEGTRLRPLTRHRPKPMLPAANRPILEYVFDALIDAGIEALCCVVGYGRDRVQDHFGSTYRDVPIEYVTQEKQLGSGHALLQAREVAGDRFLCVNGDQIAAQRIIADVLSAVEASDGEDAAVIAVLERDELSAYGAVTLDGDYVTELIENPAPDRYSLLNAGVYALTDGIFADLAAADRVEGVLTLPDVLASCIAADDCAVRGVRTEGIWIDATYPWDLLTVARELLSVGWVEDTESADGVWVSADARVHESATLQAPVVVDADCVIGPEAVVGNGALGRNVTVGANAVVQGSVLDADTRVGANATVIDSVTGQGVRADAGVTVPSGRTDVTVAGEVHEDRRLGAVLADRVHAMGASSFAPGALVGPGVRVRSGAHVSGAVSEGAEVVR